MYELKVICPFTDNDCNDDAVYNVSLLRKAFFAYDTKIDKKYKKKIIRCLKDEGIEVTPFELPRLTDLIKKFRALISEADFVAADLSCWRRAEGTPSNPNVAFETGLSMSIDKPVILIRKSHHRGTTDLQGWDQVLLPSRNGKKAWEKFAKKFQHAIYDAQARVVLRPFGREEKRRVKCSADHKKFRMLDFLDMQKRLYAIQMMSGPVMWLNANLTKFLDEATRKDLSKHLSGILRISYERAEVLSAPMNFIDPTDAKIFEAFQAGIRAFTTQTKYQLHIDILPKSFFANDIKEPNFRFMGFSLSSEQRKILLHKMHHTLKTNPHYKLCLIPEKIEKNEEMIVKNGRFCVSLNRNVESAEPGTISWVKDDVEINTQRLRGLLQLPETVKQREQNLEIIKQAIIEVKKLRSLSSN